MALKFNFSYMCWNIYNDAQSVESLVLIVTTANKYVFDLALHNRQVEDHKELVSFLFWLNHVRLSY